MKNKFLLISVLILAFALSVSCKHKVNPAEEGNPTDTVDPAGTGGSSGGSQPSGGNGDSPSTDGNDETIKYNGTLSSMTLMQKTEYVFNKEHPDYYDQIINFGNSYDSEQSYETFDYTDYDFDTKLGKYASKVFDDEEGKTVLEESVVTIEKVAAEGETPEHYSKTAEYFKYNNGAKEAKAYMVEYSEAEDVDFTRKTLYQVKENDSVKSYSKAGYDEDKLPLYEVEFYPDSTTKKIKSLKMYDNDKVFKRCESVLTMNFEEDPVNNPDVYCTMEFFEYEDDSCSDYILRRFYSAVMINGYNTLFPDGTFNDKAVLGEDDFDELPSSYEGRKYSKYNGKEYPVIVTYMNENWEVENQIKNSYAKRPDSEDYYECESRTYSRKSGQDENAIIMEEDTRTKRTYSYKTNAKNGEKVLSVNELIYANKAKYGSSYDAETNSGSKEFNN